jgi:heme A synthase
VNVPRKISDNYTALAAIGSIIVVTAAFTTAIHSQRQLPAQVASNTIRIDTLEARQSRKNLTDSIQFQQLNHKLCVIIPFEHKAYAGCPQ